MKLFLYYALHSFKNQIKKLLKTWILIFIVCCGLIGGLVGVGIGMLTEPEEDDPDYTVEEETGEFVFEDNLELVELAAGGIVFAILFISVLSSDSSAGKMFLPADVNLLFSSPMKPQSVLLFRLVTRLGLVLFMCIYFLIEVPAVCEFGIPLNAVLLLYLLVFVSLVYGQLFSLFIYIKASENEKLKKAITPGCYAFAALIVAAFAAYRFGSGLDTLSAAKAVFCSDISRFIPVWGWIKAFYMALVKGNLAFGLLMLALSFAGIAVLFVFVMRMKTDFYEDAMTKAEERAALIRGASENSSLFMLRKKKDRSEKIERDGFNRGSGASVYFWKSIYNRVRFARFGFFTKTCITYLLTGIVGALFSSFVLESRSIVFIVILLGVLVFYRATANPLERDMATPYFVLIPDSMWKKLFFSLLGSTVNCLLDLIPGMLAATLILEADLTALPFWLLFLATMDFYSSAVGSFIALSVPVSAGKNLKQAVQIMFLYFGLLPDAALIGVGIKTDHTVLALMASAVVNILLGLVFLGICPSFISPRGGRFVSTQEPLSKEMLKKARRSFSRFGLMAASILVIASAVQIGIELLVSEFVPQIESAEWYFWLLSFGPMYLVALPISYLLIRKCEKRTLEKNSISAVNMIKAFFVCEFLMIGGNIIGQLAGYGLECIFPVTFSNTLDTLLTSGSMVWEVAITVFVGPLVEEFIFRKLAIDRMSVYGEKKAIFISALAFGLYHGNIYQFFYAFFIGLVFGYIYIRSGKLRYSAMLHMGVNFCGSIIPLFVLNHMDYDLLDTISLETMSDSEIISTMMSSGVVLYAVYLLGLLAAVLIGIVCFFDRLQELKFKEAPCEVQKGKAFSVCYANPGMIFLTLLSVGLIIYSAIIYTIYY